MALHNGSHMLLLHLHGDNGFKRKLRPTLLNCLNVVLWSFKVRLFVFLFWSFLFAHLLKLVKVFLPSSYFPLSPPCLLLLIPFIIFSCWVLVLPFIFVSLAFSPMFLFINSYSCALKSQCFLNFIYFYMISD